MTKTGAHELRKDPLLGRWVAVMLDPRSPSDYAESRPDDRREDSCVFCSGREHETPPEILSVPKTGHGGTGKWWTRVVPHFDPVFHIEGELGRRGEGIYDKMNSVGANEIVVESPEHAVTPEDIGLAQMTRVISTYRERMTDLEKDHRLRYTLIYKNYGREAGAIFSHPVSHLVSTPFIPKRVKEELDGAKQYFEYKERCIFCDMLREELRLGSRVIFETQGFVAFCPYASKFPFEVWIIPKAHRCAFQDISSEEAEDLALILSTILKKLRGLLKGPAFNYFIHSAPNRIPRKDHWHTLGEDYHWHIEIMPRLLRMSGFELGSGCYILPTSPEHACKYLREV